MKTKTFILPILFIFLFSVIFTSCENNSVNDEISNNENTFPEFYQIDPEQVQSPSDAEDEE